MKKVIWITGGGTGIGKAVAIKFANQGWNVAISGRRENILKKVEDINPNIKSFPLDVNDKGKCFEIMNNIKDEFGDIDICFFSTGTWDPKKEREIDVEQIENVFKVNFFGTLNCIKAVEDHFRNRKSLLISLEEVSRTWKITNEGMKISSEDLEEKIMIAEITPELLQGSSWQNAEFKPYDVSLESSTPLTGKPHPMQSLIERIRSIFLEMGFTEIDGDYVQTAGWNMDALFIPQDHPAREMQDTFYLSNPESIQIDEKRLEQWKEIHEHGGDTGSIGWGGEFSNDIAQRGLLRTHTTVNTVKYISENPNKPCRVFGIGRVFRNESIDRTHLPEFHQIEGIIMEPGANLPMLVTTLKTFYEKMGYPEVRVRPAYFPYTEPSLEVEVKWRGQWLELGGAGIFRPEVTEPLGCSSPVLAWGMGLERLAMLVLGLDDIRQLYISDLEWLKSQPVL